MRIHLRFFASVREKIGLSEETIVVPENIQTVEDVRKYLILRGTSWKSALEFPGLRMALNHKMVAPNTPIIEEAEVAFFPPVTGG